jgi:hypothetical protein
VQMSRLVTLKVLRIETEGLRPVRHLLHLMLACSRPDVATDVCTRWRGANVVHPVESTIELRVVVM